MGSIGSNNEDMRDFSWGYDGTYMFHQMRARSWHRSGTVRPDGARDEVVVVRRGFEAENRVAYVAATRTKKRLIIVPARTRRRFQYPVVS